MFLLSFESTPGEVGQECPDFDKIYKSYMETYHPYFGALETPVMETKAWWKKCVHKSFDCARYNYGEDSPQFTKIFNRIYALFGSKEPYDVFPDMFDFLEHQEISINFFFSSSFCACGKKVHFFFTLSSLYFEPAIFLFSFVVIKKNMKQSLCLYQLTLLLILSLLALNVNKLHTPIHTFNTNINLIYIVLKDITLLMFELKIQYIYKPVDNIKNNIHLMNVYVYIKYKITQKTHTLTRMGSLEFNSKSTLKNLCFFFHFLEKKKVKPHFGNMENLSVFHHLTKVKTLVVWLYFKPTLSKLFFMCKRDEKECCGDQRDMCVDVFLELSDNSQAKNLHTRVCGPNERAMRESICFSIILLQQLLLHQHKENRTRCVLFQLQVIQSFFGRNLAKAVFLF
ncbi:hypothetical protein RFI_34772, partial [Reticulomyxa filosa]